jgi:hypothetical protein
VTRASWAGLLVFVLAIISAYVWRDTLFVNTYQVNVNIRTVTQTAAVRREVAAARAFVVQRLASSVFALSYKDYGLDVTPEVDANGVPTQRTIGLENISYRGLDRNALAQIAAMLGATYDLRTDESGRVDYDRNTQIVVAGPFLLFGPTDGAFLLEVALLVFAFGALEIRRRDPLAYPSGLHPIVVFLEIALIGSIGVTLIALRQHSVHPTPLGYVVIFLLANVALVRWLWVSRAKWSGHLRANYCGIIVALAAVDLMNGLTFLAK